MLERPALYMLVLYKSLVIKFFPVCGVGVLVSLDKTAVRPVRSEIENGIPAYPL